MSLWWIGPPAEHLSLEAPAAPTEAQRVPCLLRAVVSCRFVAVACGGAHAMALTHDGRLFGWGWNLHGQCGIGDEFDPQCVQPVSLTVSVCTPSVCTRGACSVYKIGTLSHPCALPQRRPTPRALGRLTGRRVAAVACGAAHTVALVEETPGESCAVYAWGAHAAGQLGHAPTVKAIAYSSPSLVDELNGVAGPLCDGPELGLTDADGMRMEQPLSCGLAHTALVGKKGALYTWGANKHGQCGQQRLHDAVPIGSVHALAQESVCGVACGGAHTLAVSRSGRAFAFGLNATGQLGNKEHDQVPHPMPQSVPLSSMSVSAPACGEEFSLCITHDGQVFSWGFGGCGQLGHGNASSIRAPKQVACDKCVQLSCGMGSVLARTRTVRPPHEALAHLLRLAWLRFAWPGRARRPGVERGGAKRVGGLGLGLELELGRSGLSV